ncbi:MAG TPA: DUF924 family protein [Pseudomonadales bacterium]
MYQAVLKFWFNEIPPQNWWLKDPGFDAVIRERFGALHRSAHLGECWEWRKQPHGRLAEILVLDQFARNIYRDTPLAFASDAMALALAQEAIAGGHDTALAPLERAFLYMPFQHSESRIVQAESLRLFEALGEPEQYDFAVRHKAIIDQFGRFPHRNEILCRQPTVEEEAFLKTPGSSF